MAKNDVVDVKSTTVGGIGTSSAFAARITQSEMAPSAGGGSRMMTSKWSAIEAMPSASRFRSVRSAWAMRAASSYSAEYSFRFAGTR